jgi:transcription elongation factor GreA-like protein/transcription elongation GreA/GreB family factor
MSTTVLSKISEKLNEEKWTRAGLKEFNNKYFDELDPYIDEALKDSDIKQELEELCKEHLIHSKHSLVSLYVLGVLNLENESLDDSYMLNLIEIFNEHEKWSVVKALSNKMLEYGLNKYALRHLVTVFEHEKNDEKLKDTWEKIVRIDYEEAELAEKLAQIAESDSNTDVAVDYYKKALHRYLNKKMFSQVIDIWKKLINLRPDDLVFYYHVETKTAKLFPVERSIQLLEELYPHFKNQGKWNHAIDVLKRILTYDEKNGWARQQIVECYSSLHSDHSLLKEYLDLSNLAHSWRNVHEAINDFEKHISFDTGNFVFHKNWGVGRIKKLSNDEITINFINKPNHSMKLGMAINSLTVLSNDHIWVYRITKKPEALKKRIKENHIWALKTLIRSFDNATDMKKIKSELVPYILDENEWSSWSTKARALLKTNEIFGNLPGDPDTYVVRDQPITFLEKTYNRFKAEKEFDNRVKIVQEYLEFVDNDSDDESVDSDYFREMFDYFVSYSKPGDSLHESHIIAYVVIHEFIHRFDFLKNKVSIQFDELTKSLNQEYELFANISNGKIRIKLLEIIKREFKEKDHWKDIYLYLAPIYLNKDLVEQLVKGGKERQVFEQFQSIFRNYKDEKETFIWYIRTFYQEQWFIQGIKDIEKIIIALLNLMDITARDVENRRDLTLNRKLNRQLETFLFSKEKILFQHIEKADEDSINRLFSLAQDIKDIEKQYIKDLKVIITKKYPKFKFSGASDTALTTITKTTGFYATEKSLKEKQKAYTLLQTVEVPKNSEEIRIAREYGDLKENAEYKAAKERQDMLNSTASRWKEEMEKVQVIKPEEVDPTRIGYGVVAKLENLNTKTIDTYTIMGPWESNPEKLILSHLSPFASEIMGKRVGDEVSFKINTNEFHFIVKSIELADFDSIEPVPSTV